MPDIEYRKIKPSVTLSCSARKEKYPFVELLTTTNFSFLRGGSHPEEFVSKAAELGYHGIGISDRNSLAGVVRGHIAAKEVRIPFFIGARFELHLMKGSPQTFSLAAYASCRETYGKLCSLLSRGKMRVEKGSCSLTLDDFLEFQNNFVSILIPPSTPFHDGTENAKDMAFIRVAEKLRENAKDKDTLSIALSKTYTNNSFRYVDSVMQASEYLGIPLVATNDAHYHIPERRPLQDVLTCIRNRCTIEQAGFLLEQNAEKYLKPPEELYRQFRDLPNALRRTIDIKERIHHFSLDELRYEYPDEICPGGKSSIEYLTELAWDGARQRYGSTIPEKIKKLLTEELALIHELQYEKYFLTCFDIVKFARSKGILCQGRGAAANSAVCFCLGITAVNPDEIDTLFARFVSKEREEPPDIDIDFEHERREEVIQYIYEKYGRHRAGLTAEVISYRHRSSIRDVGKALGLSLAVVDKLAKSMHRWTRCEIPAEDLLELGLNPNDATVQNAFLLAGELLGFPRHLSQHVGGFIISERALSESVPILNASMENRTIIEWDKDDIDALGMLKIDILALGMLTCIRKALHFINRRRLHEGKDGIELSSIPHNDTKVYDMICQSDTIGVFQIESRAQMSMLPRLKPRCFYDLVIEVAIVRPGPIQGNMVHPYLKRRNGIEKISFPDKRVEAILGKTMGVPIFQEQAMRLAIVLANFSPGEAEKLRRAMAAWKRNKGLIETFQKRIIEGMIQNGYSYQFAETCVSQIKGFSEYGFPESHAASFALLAYASAWIKRYYPAEFTAALLNSQPMGFYAPSQLVSDVKHHGVVVRNVDVNKSSFDSSLEKEDEDERHSPSALRLGMRLVRGLNQEQALMLNQAVKSCGEFTSIASLWKIAKKQNPKLRIKTLQLLAKADAFRSMGLGRREAFWEIAALPPDVLPLDDIIESKLSRASLPKLTKQQAMFNDYEALGLSLKAHPVSFIREELSSRGVSTALALKLGERRPGSIVAAAGLAICRQRPGTAKGVVFITLEDETGMTNLIIKPEIFERSSKIIIASSALLAVGTLERVGEVVYLSVQKLESLDSAVIAGKDVPLPSKSYSY